MSERVETTTELITRTLQKGPMSVADLLQSGLGLISNQRGIRITLGVMRKRGQVERQPDLKWRLLPDGAAPSAAPAARHDSQPRRKDKPIPTYLSAGEQAPHGIREIRLRKSGSLCITVAGSVRMFASQRGVTDLVLDGFTSNEFWKLAEAFKTAAVRKFEEESGGQPRGEVLYAAEVR